MTPAQFKQARSDMGKTQAEFARLLGLGVHGERTIRRIEDGARVTGPMGLAVTHLLATHTSEQGQ